MKRRVTPPRKFTPLKRATNIPVWADVAARLGLVLFLIGIVVTVHWFDREGLQDNHDNVVSFLDVVYFTMISITTTGFGDIAPISDRSRLIEAVIVTPIRMAVIFVFVGTAYTFVIKKSWEKWRMARIQKSLSGHILVLGFGVSGSEAVRELIARGTEASNIVVVERDPERLEEAVAMGCVTLEGDATRDETLLDVRIETASAVLVSAGRDDTGILIVLTVRHLVPTVPITVVVRAADNELLARQAGATTVINPVSFTGLLLAGSAQGEHVSDYLADLASISGDVQLVEREVRPEEVGRSIDELTGRGRGMRIYRSGRTIGFWEHEAQMLQTGDRVVEVLPIKGPL